MEAPAQEGRLEWSSAAEFPDTEWSVVLSSATSDPGIAADALDKLCRTYLTPVYAYFRVALGIGVPEAQDLAVEFALRLGTLSKNLAARDNPRKARFRDFLRACARNYAWQVRERATAQRRGGDQRFISFESNADWLVDQVVSPSPTDAELAFDREWAATLVSRAQEIVAKACQRNGEVSDWEAYRPFLVAPLLDGHHALIAKRLGISPEASKKRLERLRRQFRTQLRSLVARTLQDPADLDAELRHLVRVWVAHQGPPGPDPNNP